MPTYTWKGKNRMGKMQEGTVAAENKEAVIALLRRQQVMVSAVTEPEHLLTAAHELASRVSANPPHVLRMTKRLLREGQHQSLESILELSAAMQAVAHHTEDHHEAVGAMLERRTPQFSGR